MPRSPLPSSTLPALLSITLLSGLAACSEPPGTRAPAGSPPSGSTTATSRNDTAASAAITALPASLIERFSGCEQLLTYYQANALEQVGPYGIGGGSYEGGWLDDGEDAASSGVASQDSGGSPSPEHSSTNVQEEGVDEADIVKTDGRIIVTTITGRVQVVDVATEEVISTVRLPGRQDQVYPGELLLHGSTLVVLSSEWSNWIPADDGRQLAFQGSRTVVTTVDLSDPADPRTLGSARIEGTYQSARMVGDTVRMVMVSEPPSVEQTWPKDGRLSSEEEAEEANRQLIRDTEIDDWIPHVQVLNADGTTRSTQPLLDCGDISRPRDPAGLSTMSVLSFDIGSGTPEPTSGAGLVASGSTVYASTDRLIVATNRWDPWRWTGGDISEWGDGSTAKTDLHSFDISDPSGTTYRASGTVDGYLLSQWALDEEDGVIRVATTTDPRAASQDSESSLVMLREDGDTLAETGRVDGLGLTEQVRAVRYLSPDLAAIVTFRQTDPLYLIDTSDPTGPRVTGELKIPGYSAYLHPIDEDTLLGVGQDADPETGETKGLQVSLFDISDLGAPKQTHVMTWEDGYSPVEWDHRAFTYWPATDQVFLPMSRWAETKQESFGGVVVLDVDQALTEDGRISVTPGRDDYWGEGPSRTIVIGDQLWTLDYEGLARFDRATLAGGWAVDLR
ncbi:beta-propeller domain-containing protein [Ornithinimicrobium cryptoxanthini]|uniref:Beta-propeller domain-containing protein n=1 Tax=Ornithinimicrobium cryptoxanthini TaxID=2934161 RepID=A0ABY4YGR4_9MICO|nr:beta-propeller domain-containing protein [Ornithinimicrobium cryptoxanthini]USQ75938.1 beta-propeller domain-containing protein [Ornithinimicrobium cryptoxanthini]